MCVVEPILPRVRSSYSVPPVTPHPLFGPPRGSKLKWQWGQIRRVAKNAYPCHRPISNESHDAIANLSPSAFFFFLPAALHVQRNATKWKCLKRDDPSVKSPTPFVSIASLEKFSSNRTKSESDFCSTATIVIVENNKNNILWMCEMKRFHKTD